MIDRIAPPSALAGRPLARACHPAETLGEDSAARLGVKATPSVWRSAALLSAPRQPWRRRTLRRCRYPRSRRGWPHRPSGLDSALAGPILFHSTPSSVAYSYW